MEHIKVSMIIGWKNTWLKNHGFEKSSMEFKDGDPRKCIFNDPTGDMLCKAMYDACLKQKGGKEKWDTYFKKVNSHRDDIEKLDILQVDPYGCVDWPVPVADVFELIADKYQPLN